MPRSSKSEHHALHAPICLRKVERELFEKQEEQKFAAIQLEHERTIQTYNQLGGEIAVPPPPNVLASA